METGNSTKCKFMAQRRPSAYPNRGKIPTTWHLSSFVLAKVCSIEHLFPKMFLEKVVAELNVFARD
jgi:hypothetical protein